MTFVEKDGLRFFRFDSFPDDVLHGVFTRRGGESPAPWASLNVGGTVGDDPDRVRRNRFRLFETMGRDPASIFDVWLVHGAETVFAESPRGDAPYQKADILFTDSPDVTLFMRFADCVPILLYDPVHRVGGIAHAGWRGSLLGVAATAVRAMSARYASSPRDILAGIGPSIGPDHYEVGEEVVAQAREIFGEDSPVLLPYGEKYHLDLWAVNRLFLEEAGVTHIEVAEICTACHLEDWFSHRGEHGKTGRFGALLALT
jgi:YfiH family protein